MFEDVSRLRSAGVPVGWVLVDNPWESCVGTLRFDARRFPDAAGLIRRVHALGLRFMLWVSPKTQCNVGYTHAQLLGPIEQLVIDLRQPAVTAMFQRRLRALVALGIDGVKADRGDEVDLQPLGSTLQNDYPLLYARAVMGALPRGSAAIFRRSLFLLDLPLLATALDEQGAVVGIAMSWRLTARRMRTVALGAWGSALVWAVALLLPLGIAAEASSALQGGLGLAEAFVGAAMQQAAVFVATLPPLASVLLLYERERAVARAAAGVAPR